MKRRILLALACAAVLLIALMLRLRVDETGAAIAVGADSATKTSMDSRLELSTPPATAAAISDRASVASDASLRKSGLEAKSDTGPTISGVVMSTKDGRPFAHVTITATQPALDLNGSQPFDDFTDDSGRFAIHNARVGRWTLVFTTPGFRSVEQTVMVSEGSVSAFVQVSLTPEVPQRKLLVRLRAPDGRPLLNGLEGPELDAARMLRPVVVAECPRRDADLPASASVVPIRAVAGSQSDEWFVISMEGTDNACCCLLLGKRVLDAVAFTAATNTLALVATRDDLQRSLGSVSVTVVDDVSGQPLTAFVQALPETGEMRSMTTDANGNARVEHLLQGEGVVRVFSALRAPITRKVVIRPGENVDLGVIRMVKTIEISGSVEPPKAKVQPDSPLLSNGDREMPSTLQPPSVYAYRIDPDQPVPQAPSATARVDANGAFQLADLPRGEYLLSSGGNRPPSIEAVQQKKVLGWVYVDARFGSASGVRVP
jgi:hypothetical protein